MAKSSINILQEICVAQYNLIPNYVIKDVSPSVHSPRFEVTVEVDKVRCSVQAPNKKQAKESCARMALDELGIKAPPPIGSPAIELKVTDNVDDANFNAVGKLNEYASKNKLPYPVYNEVGTNERGLIIIECSLGQAVANGLGALRKSAKQNAAAALLKQLQKPQTDTEGPPPEKVQRRLTGDQVDSTTASSTAALDKTEVKTEIVAAVEEESEKLADDVLAEENKDKDIPEIEKHVEKTETEQEEDMLEEFRIKLSKLGIEDNNNLNVHTNGAKGHIIMYKNEDCKLNIVKISYNLKKTLGDVYDHIKERVQS